MSIRDGVTECFQVPNFLLMNRVRHLLLFLIAGASLAGAVWSVLRVRAVRSHRPVQLDYLAERTRGLTTVDMWTRGIEKVKEDRGGEFGGGSTIAIPSELRHYTDRHWFLATQVAEVRKFNVQSCQDFLDLAAMIQRGELVSLPAVTDSYILFGVGAKADEGAFTRYDDEHNITLFDEVELRAVYNRLDYARAKLQTEISDLQTQLSARKKSDRAKQAELRKEVAARQDELKANDEEKALLDQSYGRPEARQKLLRDYESLQALAKNFAGRSYNLNNSSDRRTMKVSMLSSLRPPALKILEELAKAYHDQFARPLPVSSLVRPEQYQHALHRMNRNAVLIDTPPHSTGLAFDINYRYMSGAEQNFLMTELARLKSQGRIEVLRERNANFHIFAFIDGKRPNDELITASLDGASLPVKETNHAVGAQRR
jgi:Family of unknown function (DUF5715)